MVSIERSYLLVSVVDMPYRALAEAILSTQSDLARELISEAPHLRVPVVQAVLQDASGAMNAIFLALETDAVSCGQSAAAERIAGPQALP